MGTRSEHLKWCKLSANKHIDKNELQEAFVSFQSNMSRHQDTTNHLALELGTMLLLGGHLSTKGQMKEWINGFN